MAKIIILPGLDGTGKMLAAFTNKLGQQHDIELITYSTETVQTYNELADFVREKLPEKTPYILLAESFSGPVAALIIKMGAPNLRALIFASSFVKRPVRLPQSIATLSKALPLQSKRLVQLARPMTFGRWSSTELEERLHDALNAVQPDVLLQRLKSVLSVDMSKALVEFKKPALYLQPTHDRLVGKAAALTIEAEINHLEIRRISGPHFILQAQPDACAKVVCDFLSIA